MVSRQVALYRGDERYTTVKAALEAIDADIDVSGKKRVIIKPNFVTVNRQAAATHVDAVRAVVEMLWAKGIRHATLVAGPAIGTTAQGFANYGYQPLIDEYGLDVVDLNHDDSAEVEVLNEDLEPLVLPVSKTVLESDYRISVGPPKTHDFAIITASLKNYAVGALVGRKARVHPDIKTMNINLYKLAPYVHPHLSVLDGFVAMEGNGPVSGDVVDWKLVLASANWLAADALVASLMGYEPEKLGWLYYSLVNNLGIRRLEEIELVGNVQPDDVRRNFRDHRNYPNEIHWQIPNVERFY